MMDGSLNHRPFFIFLLNLGFIEQFTIENKMFTTPINVVRSNPYPEIFTLIGYKIFLKMHDSYKCEENKQAHYSFLFYALRRDGYLVCSNKDFIHFLSSYNIHITKIDSRQSGKDNNRVAHYESVKENI